MSTASWAKTKTRQVLGQNLDAALVIGRNMHIDVPEKRVESDTRTRLPANSSQHALSGSGTFLESPRPWASGEVVSLQIKWFAAPAASRLGDWQWKGQPLQQQHPEEVWSTRVPWVRGTSPCQHCAPNATSTEHGAKRDGQSTLRSSCNGCRRQRMPNIAKRAAIRLGHVRRSVAVASRREVPPNWVATKSACVPTLLPLL